MFAAIIHGMNVSQNSSRSLRSPWSLPFPFFTSLPFETCEEEDAFLFTAIADAEEAVEGPAVCLDGTEGRLGARCVGVSLFKLLFSSISSSVSENKLLRSSFEAEAAARPYFLSERVLALTCWRGKVCLVAGNDVAEDVGAGDIDLDDEDEDNAADLE